MAASAESIFADIVRHSHAFIMSRLETDAIALRPDKPRIRSPLTPLAEKIFRVLLFTFANVLTGLCNPSLATLARATGCADSSVKRLLPELYRTEYVTWKKGKRKRVLTRKGWRVVRSSNRYRLLCPRRHLAELRRWLMRLYRGQHGNIIQTVVSLCTPPTEEAKAAEKIVVALAQDLRPNPARTVSPTQDSDPPSQAPPEPQGSVEIGGVQVHDPKLGGVLSGLWAALEKREQNGQ